MAFLDRICGFFSSVFGSSNRRSSRQDAWYLPHQERSGTFHDGFNRSAQRSFGQAPATTLPRTGSRPTRLEHNSVSGERQRHTAAANRPPFSSTTTSPYSLTDFTFKVNSLPKDRSFTPQNNIVYQNQWTTCYGVITDDIGNRVERHDDVEITCSNPSVEFRNATIQNGRLQFSMIARDARTITTVCISIKKYSCSDRFTLTKDICVSSNPCSDTLSELTIKEIIDCKNGNCKCIYRVKLVDVFGDPAVWNADCNLEVVQHEDGVEIEKQKCVNDGHLCFDISIKGKRPWSKEVGVFLNGEKIPLPEKYEVTNDERDTLLSWRLVSLDDYDYEPIPDFLIWENSRVFIPSSPCLDDGKLVPYDDKMCKLEVWQDGDYKLVCQNTTKNLIMGPDFAHVNNIKRVLQLTGRLQLQETPDRTSIILEHDNVPKHLYHTCKEVVLHLLRGSYYRKKASEAARVRMDWKERVNSLDGVLDSSSHQSSPALAFCKYFKDFFGNLMHEYNRNACEELFLFFNFSREQSEVDLHGLLVTDEERLELLKLNLLSGHVDYEQLEEIITMCRLKGNRKGQILTGEKNRTRSRQPHKEIRELIESCQTSGDEKQLKILKQELEARCNRNNEIDKFLTQCRSDGDEAIQKLQEFLECFDLEEALENKSPWIEIIVGAGHHSRKKEKQNIRPKVEKFLKARGYKFTAVNKGSLVVTFVEYNGQEPCFGEYYCENCDRCWKSSKSYIGKYQQCSRCRKKCWPVKQREKEKVLNYHRDGKEIRKSKPHQADLCQKCRELGHPCNEN